MNILVPVKMVPDLVEELLIHPSGKYLDSMYLRMILNEFDDHAIEQAVLLKETYGGQVVVFAVGMDGVEDALFTASAKGADRLVHLVCDVETGMNNHALAKQLAPLLLEHHPDLVLTGVQAHNDLDGSLGPLLAGYMDFPYLGYVAGIELGEDERNSGKAVAKKEYPGGLVAEVEIVLPAVLGIQASAQPPRYVAFNKIRNAMKTAQIEEFELGAFDLTGGAAVSAMSHPETGAGAEMLVGGPDEVAVQITRILQQAGLL